MKEKKNDIEKLEELEVLIQKSNVTLNEWLNQLLKKKKNKHDGFQELKEWVIEQRIMIASNEPKNVD